ncbi:MAG TPA: T9SS type A sorting domain-containing protein, partial [Saprospiraceae bacterium]|nr:T9SS type A sorting domain-containing protein [Saprospiraceae bacterium]
MNSLKILFCLVIVHSNLFAQLKLEQIIKGSRAEFGARVVLSDDGKTLLITSENYNIQNDVFRLYIYHKTLKGWTLADSIVNVSKNDLQFVYLCTSFDGTIIASNKSNVFLNQSILLLKFNGSKYDSIYTIANDQGTQYSFATCLKLSNDGKKLISNYLGLNLFNTYENNGNAYQRINSLQKPSSPKIFARSLDLSGDGLFMVANNLAQFLPNVSGNIEFYQWQDNKWVLHSFIPNDDGLNFFGNRVVLSDDGQKCVFGITSDTAEIIRSYKRIGFEWIQYGKDIVLDHCELLDFNEAGTVLDVSADGNVLCVSPSYCRDPKDRFKIFRNLNDNWNEIKLPSYEDTKYAPSQSANISDDGKTVVVGFSKIKASTNFPDYVAVYSLDNSNAANENQNKLKVYPNPTNNFVQIQGLQEEAIINIQNINGQFIKTMKTTHYQIDISDLPNALYIFEIQN